MSEQVKKLLSQLVKTQLEKKSSKKTNDKPLPQRHVLTDEKIVYQTKKANVREKQELGLKVSKEEQFTMLRRMIVENITKILMITLYCVVAFIAIFKAGIIILTAFQHFLHGIFAAAPPSITPSS
jgi:hypothetical protein